MIFIILFVDYPWYISILIVGNALLTPIIWINNVIGGLLSFIIMMPFRLLSIVFRFITFRDLVPKCDKFDYENTITKIIGTLQEYHYDEWALEVMKASSSCTTFSEIKAELLSVLPKLVSTNIDYEIGIEKEVTSLIKFLRSIC